MARHSRSRAPLAGRGARVCRAGAKYTVIWNGKTVLHGTYTVTGSDMSLTDKSGEVKCPGTGKYSFKVTGHTLTMKKIKGLGGIVSGGPLSSRPIR